MLGDNPRGSVRRASGLVQTPMGAAIAAPSMNGPNSVTACRLVESNPPSGRA